MLKSLIKITSALREDISVRTILNVIAIFIKWH